MRAVFLGTPEAAVPALDALTTVADVRAVITQPDRPRGRSGTPVAPPVKRRADELGIPVVQPSSGRSLAGVMADLGPIDIGVLAAFGLLVLPDALEVPSHGIVNVHFSLLPRWRGAAPVHRAILAGDGRTGVTLIRLDAGLDTGPILATRSTAIGSGETTGSLTARLAMAGAELMATYLGAVVEGAIVAVPQDPAAVTLAPKIDRDERWFDPHRTVDEVLRHIRAMDPAPGAWAHHASGRFRVRAAVEGPPAEASDDVGRLRRDNHDRLLLVVGDGTLELVVVQPEGRRSMSGGDWARGRPGDLGTVT